MRSAPGQLVRRTRVRRRLDLDRPVRPLEIELERDPRANGVTEDAAQVVGNVEAELRLHEQVAEEVVLMAALELERRVLRRLRDPARVVAVELGEAGASERACDVDEGVRHRNDVEVALDAI